jgi:putative sterol carrier protein
MPDVNTLMSAMRARSSSLRGLGYRVQFMLEDTGDTILLDASTTKVEVSEEEGEADTVLRLSSADLGKLIAGKLSPMMAFSLGKLKVDGSKGVAMKLASLLDED